MTANRYVLAVDEGSTGVRAMLLDGSGRVAGRAYRELETLYPAAGRVEQDADGIWQKALAVAREALASAGVAGGDVAAIGITGQRSTAVAWNRRTGRALHPAISWQDLRASERCEELLAEGYFVTPQVAALKLEWMLRNVPAVRRAADAGHALLGTIESWLAWKLSGGAVHVTDASFASASGLYEFFEKRWNFPLVRRLGIPEASLAQIRPSSERYAEADRAHFGAPIPLAGMAGDQQAAMFGQACFEPGSTKASYGTSAMVDLNAGSSPILSQHGAYPLVLWKLGEEITWCLEGQAVSAGAAVQWLRDGLGVIVAAGETDALARSVPDTGGVWAVPAFQGLGTPYLDSGARGAIGGLSRASTRAQVVRAVLEGIAFRCREVVEALAADSPSGLPAVLRVDGGASANDFLMQFQSDVLGVPVERPETIDAAGVGAGYMAGLAVGLWTDLDELRSVWRLGSRFEPRMSAAEREERYARFRELVTAVRTLGS